MNVKMFYCLYLTSILIYWGAEASSCKARTYGSGNIVCVCNETYCDELVLFSSISPKEAALYETNKNGARFQSSLLKFSSTKDTGIPLVSVNASKTYQLILGFGGAFTDAVGINLKSASPQLQKQIMKSYFHKVGLQYNMGRIPIASCDFSTRPYSYDDVKDDFDLLHFQLAKEDFLYKIPFIQMASSLSKDNLLLFGSPWSAPAWMKTNNAMNGKGSIKGQPGGKYYVAWANYFLRFLQAYKENNITLWGLTMQNEPSDGCLADFPFQATCFTAEQQRDFLKKNLGPTLMNAGFGPDTLRLMILDDVKVFLPHWADIVMADEEAAQYVSGVAYHWYYEDAMPQKLINITHSHHPDLFYLSTEACIGSYPWEQKVSLGDWSRAERYAHDITQSLLNWSVGWIDWNLVLDMHGGPNWVKNFVDAPIILNAKAKEFYKQPMYYALAHFSKCLPRGSIHIGLEIPDTAVNMWQKVDISAFKTPQDQIVVIVVNRKNENIHFFLHYAPKGFLNVTVAAHSIHSYVF